MSPRKRGLGAFQHPQLGRDSPGPGRQGGRERELGKERGQGRRSAGSWREYGVIEGLSTELGEPGRMSQCPMGPEHQEQ